MSKNYVSNSRRIPAVRSSVHPVWMGIGFILMILIPVLAYLASPLILEENAKANWFPLPVDLIIKFQDPYILIKLLITLVICFLVYVLFLLVTFVLNSLFGPRRYIPPDVPPVHKHYVHKK
jgi:hypothetical protein